jgi:hypothetical protein
VVDVIDNHCELVRPAAKPVAQKKISALDRRVLSLRPECDVVEHFLSGLDKHSTRGCE